MRWVLAIALVAASLAGCADSDDSGGDGTTTTGGATTTGVRTTGTRTTTDGGEGGATVRLSADSLSGTAPLNVTFGLSASGGTVSSWRLAFGDGSEARTGSADDIPQSVSHTYQVGGNFTASFNVTFKGGTSAGDSVSIQVIVPDSGPPPPSHFEFGPAGGCENSYTDAVGCVSFRLGPDHSGIDGHWLPLDNRYWGKTFTSTIQPEIPGDSDCIFVAADKTTVLGDAHNVDQECGGVVPPETAWIFIYSYVTPQQAITVDFAF